jgi:hypothetical protein
MQWGSRAVHDTFDVYAEELWITMEAGEQVERCVGLSSMQYGIELVTSISGSKTGVSALDPAFMHILSIRKTV